MADGTLLPNGVKLDISGVSVENSTGTGIEIRRLDDGTVEISRCCIRVPKAKE